MENPYVTVKTDSFTDQTTITSNHIHYSIPGRRLDLTETANLLFLYHESQAWIVVGFSSAQDNPFAGKGSSSTLETIKDAMQTFAGEWAFLRNGNLILQLNGKENIPLDPVECSSEVTTENITNANACSEVVMYRIDKELLERICECNSIRMRLSGSAGSWILEGDHFKFMAKAFFHTVFDSSRYSKEIEEEFQKDAEAAAKKKKGCIWSAVSVVIGTVIAVAGDDNTVATDVAAVLILGPALPWVISYSIKEFKRNIRQIK